MQKTVVVGMSGGVDSSVTAFLLKKQGYNTIGFFMKNWEEEEFCSAAKDYEDVVAVCEKIGIPYYTVNFAKEYRENVFSHFLEDYKQGLTPNPDILCNREIKFKVFLEKAKKFGADFLATGHFAKIVIQDGKNTLVRANDKNKDQSYFLYTLNHEILSNVLFPVGHLTKAEIRKIAHENGLITAEKKDSTGICFIGERNFLPFLGKYLGFQEGPIKTLSGETVGKHRGVAFYTLGQRKGLQIGGKGEAWFVVEKDVFQNTLIVAQGENHSALFCQDLVAKDLTWVSKTAPQTPFKCTAKVRYRQEDQLCTIKKIENEKAFVVFDSPQRAVTPGQSIVFYDKELCLGGGVIEKKGLSLYQQPL
jgi:tRNA-uridine 2-sulfurtransferase